MTKICFVDVDGPMIPLRAYKLPKQTPIVSVFDPCAVAMLKALLDESGAKIVVSSTWGDAGKVKCAQLFRKNGLNPKQYFHEDWITPRRFSFGETSRTMEIKGWLNNHPEVTHYVALDDESLTHDILPHAVQCDAHEGFSWRNYLEAKIMLGIYNDEAEKQNIEADIWYKKRREILRTIRRTEPNAYLTQEAANLVFPRMPPNKDDF